MGVRVFGAASLGALGVLLTMGQPTQAQSGDTCTPHNRGREIRCATTRDIQGTKILNAKLIVSNLRPRTTATAIMWVSQCGAPGEQAGSFPIGEGQTNVSFIPKTLGTSYAYGPPRSICTEIFITDCRQNGSPAACPQAFLPSDFRIELTFR